MRFKTHRRSIYGLLLAGAYGFAVLVMAQSGLVYQANGMIAVGVFLATYYSSRLTGFFLLAAYLIAAPLLDLKPLRLEDLRHWRGVFAASLFLSITTAGIFLLDRLRKALQGVAASERQLRLITESTNDIILAHDMNRRLLYVNTAVEKLIGYTVEELHSRNFINWLHPEDDERVMRHWDGAFQGIGYTNLEFRAITRSGEVKWFSGSHSPLFDEHGRQIGVRGVDRDITERKKAEVDLEASQKRFESLINTVDGIVWEVDAASFRFTFVSREAEHLLGFPVSCWTEEADFWVNQLHPDDREWAPAFCQRLTREMKDHDFEYRMIAADGRVVWLRDLVTVIVENGRPARLNGVMVDITTQKEAEVALCAARDEALDAARTKSAFLAMMSHEIRTPMNGILGMAQLLLDTALTEDQREMTSLLTESGEGLLRIINDLLDVSKIEAGKMHLEMVDFQLREEFDLIRQLLTEQASKKQLALHCSVADDVPDLVRGDSGRLRQVLLNLVGNALKFTANGEVAISCTLADDTGDAIVLRFEVRDTGVGIAPDMLPRLFQPFVQADMSTTRKYGGTGLGLAICKQIVEMMGGGIGAASQQGGGSTFWFTVPLKKQILPTRAPAEPALPAVAVSPDRQSRVLVVEDNLVNQQLILRLLDKLGYQPELAGNGLEAIAALERSAYDLVLMDCQMPEMDGYEATRRIRMVAPNAGRIPIIAMTANAMSGDRERCLEAGMDDYITKPVNFQVLRDTLERWSREAEAKPA